MTEQFIIDLGFSYKEVEDSRGLTHILLKSLTEENVEHELIVVDVDNGRKGVMETCYCFYNGRYCNITFYADDNVEILFYELEEHKNKILTKIKE